MITHMAVYQDTTCSLLLAIRNGVGGVINIFICSIKSKGVFCWTKSLRPAMREDTGFLSKLQGLVVFNGWGDMYYVVLLRCYIKKMSYFTKFMEIAI